MTVAELISELGKYDLKKKIVVFTSDGREMEVSEITEEHSEVTLLCEET